MSSFTKSPPTRSFSIRSSLRSQRLWSRGRRLPVFHHPADLMGHRPCPWSHGPWRTSSGFFHWFFLGKPHGKPGFLMIKTHISWGKTHEKNHGKLTHGFRWRLTLQHLQPLQRRELVIYRFVWIMRTIFNTPNFGVVQLAFSCAV